MRQLQYQTPPFPGTAKNDRKIIVVQDQRNNLSQQWGGNTQALVNSCGLSSSDECWEDRTVFTHDPHETKNPLKVKAARWWSEPWSSLTSQRTDSSMISASMEVKVDLGTNSTSRWVYLRKTKNETAVKISGISPCKTQLLISQVAGADPTCVTEHQKPWNVNRGTFNKTY